MRERENGKSMRYLTSHHAMPSGLLNRSRGKSWSHVGPISILIHFFSMCSNYTQFLLYFFFIFIFKYNIANWRNHVWSL